MVSSMWNVLHPASTVRSVYVCVSFWKVMQASEGMFSAESDKEACAF